MAKRIDNRVGLGKAAKMEDRGVADVSRTREEHAGLRREHRVLTAPPQHVVRLRLSPAQGRGARWGNGEVTRVVGGSRALAE
jgi:hypothetical protein